MELRNKIQAVVSNEVRVPHRYYLYSLSFANPIVIEYDDAGVLSKLDFSGSGAAEQHRNNLMRMLPIVHTEFVDKKWIPANAKVQIVEQEIEVDFDMFWNAYNLKINTARCKALWKDLSNTARLAAVANIPRYRKYTQRANIAMKNPDTYLRNRTWEDELNLK